MTTQRGDSAQPFSHPGYVSGDYFPPPFTRMTQATSVASAFFIAYPVFVPVDTPLSALGVSCTVAAASAKMLVGLYSNVAHRPGALLVQTPADLDLSTTGWKEGAITYTMLAGQLYWVCVQTAGVAAVTTSCVNNAAGIHNLLLPSTQALAANSNGSVGALAVAATYTSNTMLASAPAVVPSIATNLPLPMLKVS